MTNKIHKVLVLGAGALKIGQAGEFDYSGSQALKALKEEGIKTVLINPNIATIQTSRLLADAVYFLPVTPFFVEQVIAKEKPDGILLSFGGQTALNCGIELYEQGVLERYQVQILGTPISAIILTEDRQQFAEHLHAITIPTPRSQSATTLHEALALGEEIGFPVMVRAGFALGGQGSGIAQDRHQLEQIVSNAFAFAPQVLIEQYLHHYKEVEYEVVRDAYDNCITVCNMENMDPLGIHTGESIVVAPSQTLTNAEYHLLRSASIKIVRSLGIVGECNVQFALNPQSMEYYVIEVNARLSRSSALASKATGYPLAYVAAKLALGYALSELTNKVTGVTQACFEPSLDYLVVKIPRWDLQKFKGVDETIGTGMKSVGEVMGIGRTFEEALQKALRMLDQNVEGVVQHQLFPSQEAIRHYLFVPTPRRVFALACALQAGLFTIQEIATITGINPWFVQRIKNIIDREESIRGCSLITRGEMLELKQLGVSDQRIGQLMDKSEQEVRSLRKEMGIVPSVFQIDTLSAEFPSETNYLYLTYNGYHHDVEPYQSDGVIVIGSGPYRIGSSVEFDWTCVSTVEALKKYQKRAVIINCNPETVSTDYDVSDRLYFEELTFERLLDIYEFEDPQGVIVSVGGQTPNNRALALQQAGCHLLGTDARAIDQAENRKVFSHLLDSLSIEQPEWDTFTSLEAASRFAERVGYPVLLRPSYVLSGSAMNVCYTPEELLRYVQQATAVSPEHPVTVSKFLEQALEVELDAVAQKGEIKAFVISEHVENAGVHSGDATIVLPPQQISFQIQRRLEEIARQVAQALQITGPFNMQFLVKDQQALVIEANLRAARTFPFISKVTGINFMELFVDSLFQPDIPPVQMPALNFTSVKAAQFSFSRLTGADPVLGVEMASTGEVASFGEDLEEAYLKAVLGTGGKIPRKGVFVCLNNQQKEEVFVESVRQFSELGLPLYAPEKTREVLSNQNVSATLVGGVNEQAPISIQSCFQEGLVDLAIIVTHEHEQSDEYYVMRRLAVDANTPLFTRIELVRLFVSALKRKELLALPLKSWSEY